MLAASYGSGSISILRVREDGGLGEETAFVQQIGHSGTQTQAHPSAIDVSPDNRFVIVPDLGLDKALIYRFDPSTGALSPPDPPFAALPAASGPRHFAFDSAGKFGYLMNELTGVVTVFAWDPARGALTSVQDIPTQVPDFVGSNHTAEIAISPNGKFLYQSNRRLAQRQCTRARHHRGLCHRFRERHSNCGGTDAYRGHHAAQFRRRSHRELSAGCE